ncbi:MAG: hypothetical protein CM1200mP39_24410 [Dehalococcoidia bacterium]|nr:MAG: hypothetical protein CM1200mP39_24410 [Dehalococcoidia bacterium]
MILGKTNTSEYGHIGTNENRLGMRAVIHGTRADKRGDLVEEPGLSLAAGITALGQGGDGAVWAAYRRLSGHFWYKRELKVGCLATDGY